MTDQFISGAMESQALLTVKLAEFVASHNITPARTFQDLIVQYKNILQLP